MFIDGCGNWTDYRKLPELIEVDFHYEQELGGAYWEHMEEAKIRTLNAIKSAQAQGIKYVLFTHGHSTSRKGKQTSRSVIRGLMRSKEATPYIIRRECIQHYSVFVAKIRQLATKDASDS